MVYKHAKACAFPRTCSSYSSLLKLPIASTDGTFLFRVSSVPPLRYASQVKRVRTNAPHNGGIVPGIFTVWRAPIVRRVANPAHVRRIVPRPRRHALPRFKFEFERYLLLRFSFVFFVVCVVVRRVFFHLSSLSQSQSSSSSSSSSSSGRLRAKKSARRNRGKKHQASFVARARA